MREYQISKWPSELFHYTNSRSLLAGILETGKLRLSPFGKVNDPRESLDWAYFLMDYRFDSQDEINLGEPAVVGMPTQADRIDALKVRNVANAMRKEKLMVGCFCMNESDSMSFASFDSYHWDRYGCAKPRMWSQYGENYEGACLIFDGLNISSLAYQIATQKKLVIHDKITYVSAEHLDLPQEAFEIDSTIPESSLEDHVIDKFNRYKDLLFLRKHNDWQTESEFRIIIYDSDTDDGYFYFDLKGILKAIIVGDKMPAVYQDIVRTKCQELGCRFGKIQWQEHRYALALEK